MHDRVSKLDDLRIDAATLKERISNLLGKRFVAAAVERKRPE